MSQSIELTNNLFWDATAIHTEIVHANWIADKSSASLTTLTESTSLSKGTWLCIGSTPISDCEGASYTLRALSGSTNIGSNHYYRSMSATQTPILLIFTVASTANVVLRSAQASTINFSYTERGGLDFVKLASY
jgi:hypothetical protein